MQFIWPGQGVMNIIWFCQRPFLWVKINSHNRQPCRHVSGENTTSDMIIAKHILALHNALKCIWTGTVGHKIPEKQGLSRRFALCICYQSLVLLRIKYIIEFLHHSPPSLLYLTLFPVKYCWPTTLTTWQTWMGTRSGRL